MTGTYTRLSPTSRVLDLTLDQASIDALEEHEAALAEASLAEQGIFVNVILGVHKSKLRARISTQKKAGTATLTLVARFNFMGSVTLPDTNMIILKASARLRGKSLPIDLAGITAD
jgi:hypothetical protein